MNEIFFVLYPIGALVNCILALILFSKSVKQSAALYMAIATLAAATWNISSFQTLAVNAGEHVLFYNRLVYFSALVITLFFFYFSISFLCEEKHRRTIYQTLLSLPIIVLSYLTLFTPTIISTVNLSNPGIWPNGFGYMYPVYTIVLLIFWIFSFWNLRKKYSDSLDFVAKRQLIVLISGCSILFVISFVNELVLPYFGNMTMYWSGPLIPMAFFSIITYCILKHHLFNIEVPINEALTFILVIGSFIQVVIADDVLSSTVAWIVFIVTIAISIILIMSTFKLIRRGKLIDDMLEAKSDFLHLASHQLKTPISVILGTLDILLDKKVVQQLGEEELNSLLVGVQLKASKLNAVVSDMLEAVNVDSLDGQEHLFIYNENTNIGEILKGVVRAYRPQAESKGIEIDLKILEPGESHIVRSLPTAMNRVVSIVVDNALRYTKVGHIDIKLEKKSNNIILSVKDTGIGIPTNELDKIFDRFERASNAVEAHTDGSGIALYVAKKIMTRHDGGQIHIRSKLGSGTEVIISVNSHTNHNEKSNP